jgi:hypothetical protein
MMNRMRAAEKRARDAIVREAARQARVPFQPPRGVGGETTFISSLVAEHTTEGPDGQTQWPFAFGIDGTSIENALVPTGYPTTDYGD